MPEHSSDKFGAFRVRLHADVSREKALDEALYLLNQTEYITSEDAVEYQQGVDKKKIIREIKSKASDLDDDQKLDTIIQLLEQANFSSDDAVKLGRKRNVFWAISLIFFGMAIVLAGILIIVLDPEMIKGPTIIYFNPRDGITLSDLIALLIIGMASFCFVWSYALLSRR